MLPPQPKHVQRVISCFWVIMMLYLGHDDVADV